jgi:predicted nucleic acid-binding protein
MIVADVNLPIYLFVNSLFTQAASDALARDPHWLIPPLYKYELLNVLATHVRKNYFDIAHAMNVIDQIEKTVQVSSDPAREDVMRLSIVSRIGTYDCEYIALAQQAGTRVVTNDKEMRRAFPDVTISLEEFVAGK